MAQPCPECGFVNDEGANYCQRCGALLRNEAAGGSSRGGRGSGHCDLPDRRERRARAGRARRGHRARPALVIRAGGGRVGESFAVEGERMSIGRRPDSEVFLDDITVSRDHALLIRRGDMWHLDDCGSLNGTYVNRERIESQRLEEGDEVQIGKYKLTFHAR